VELGDWFLGPGERGNRATHIARRRPGGAEYTGGNHVEVLIDGATYYSRLAAELRGLGHDDAVRFTDWQGDSDELLDGPGTAIGDVLAEAAGRGVEVRGLLWRSHPRQTHFAEQSNARLAERVNGAGGEVVLDERVRRGGSHHQKLVVMHRPGASAMSRSSVGSICVTVGATTAGTRAIHRRCRWTIATAPGPRGTTSNWRCADRRWPTSRTRSGSGGRIRRPSTIAIRFGAPWAG
jgi:phosphatidylserine/phosphatidylglycerophosphate/cardiolipin synthase-like enzyme